MFSVRIVTTDHYMCPPLRGLDVQYAEQRGSEVKKVPVVRIFGATPAGQKTCMHVHGVFPYLYVPYDGTAPLDRYLRQFAASLDKAINVAQGQGQSTIQHVYKVVLVSGIAMYGYHDKEQQFLKIYLYNPAMIRKAADLLLGGAVLNKAFQPHEAHIPYTLQLFIDYNLYGMNMLNVGAVKFRRRSNDDNGNPVIVRDISFTGSQDSDEGLGSDPRTPVSFTALLNRSGTATPARRTWDYENIPSELYLDADVERLSTCELEVDVVAADILNRLEVNANVGANPGLAALWEDERQRRRDRGEDEDIAPPDSQERTDIERAESEVELESRLQDIVLQHLAYIDSQSDAESDEESQEVPATAASAVELHLSQTEDDMMSSQETVILEDEVEDKPVVNMDSIHRVVSSSQSFCEVKTRQEDVAVEDKSLVDILASLAEDSDTPPASQVSAATQVTALEEQDSILSQVSEPRDRDLETREAEEVLEMSQRIWDEDMTLPSQEDKDKHSAKEPVMEDFDIAGLDETWQVSQAEAKSESDDDSDSDVIPQLDGPVDDKPKTPRKRGPKRLGVTGPVRYMPRNPQTMPPNMFPTGYMTNQPYPGMPPNQQYNSNYYGGYGASSGYQQWGPGMQHSTGNQGMPQNTSLQQSTQMHNPGMQQSSRVMQSSSMQQSPSMQSPGMPQSSNMQQSPGLHHSPGSQQSPGMLQSPVGNFSSPPSGTWDPGQDFSLQNSPPVVSVYGNDNSSQPNSDLTSTNSDFNSSQTSQYQHYATNTYGYQSVPNAASSYTNSLMPSELSGYNSGVGPGQQTSPGYQSAGLESQKRYPPSQLSPGYNKQQAQFAGIQTTQLYSSAQELSQVAVAKPSSASKPRVPGLMRNNSQFSGATNADMLSSNTPEASYWQQSTSVPAANSQRFLSPQSSSIADCAMTTSAAVGSYAGFKNSLTVRASGPLQSQFASFPNNSVPGNITNTFTGNPTERTIKSFPPGQIVESHSDASCNSASPGSQMTSVISSPGANVGMVSKSGSDIISNETASSTASFISQAQKFNSQKLNATHQNIHHLEKSNDIFINDPTHTRNKLSYSQQSLNYNNVNAQNTKCAVPNSSQWNKFGIAQSGGITIPKSVVHHAPVSNFEGKRKDQASKSLPKPLVPPAEGPVSRFYRQKLGSAAVGYSGEIKSPEAREQGSTSSTPLPSPVSSVTSPGNALPSPINNTDRSSTAVHQLLLQPQGTDLVTMLDQVSQANLLECSPGRDSLTMSSSKKSSSLTSLLLEEDNEKAIIWQDKHGNQNQMFHQGNIPNQNRNRVGIHSFDSSESMNLTANHNKSLQSFTEPYSRHSLDSCASVNFSANLNDSQQDLFSDESQKLSKENIPFRQDMNLGSESTAGDDSASVFSDSMDKDINEFPSSDILTDDSHRRVVHSTSLGSSKQDDLSSLSNLKTFVGSVEKDNDYGASFQTPDIQHSNDSDVLETVLINANENVAINSFEEYHTIKSPDSDINKQSPGHFQPNMMQANNVMLTKTKRKYTRKNPNLPPIKRSQSVPGVPGLKRRRGRPRKEYVNTQLPPTSIPNLMKQNSYNQNFTVGQFQPGFKSQQFQQQNYNQQNYNQSSFFPETSYHNQVPYPENHFFPQPNTENQTVQNQSAFLSEQQNIHNQSPFLGEQQENFQNHSSFLRKPQQDIQNHSIENPSQVLVEPQQDFQSHSFQNQSSFIGEIGESQQGIQNQSIQKQSSFLGELMDENDSFDFQQSLNTSDSLAVAEQDQVNPQLETTGNVNATNENFNYNEMRNRASQEMQAFHKQQEMLSKTIFESPNIKLWKSSAQQEKQELLKETDLNAQEVSHCTSASTPQKSPAYTFQFKVPTPVYKRLKFRFNYGVRDISSKLDVVRMHPRDARKYSLMKIGTEIIRLHKLSKTKIEKIQEDLLSGKEVLGIPPALRQIEKASMRSDAVTEKEISKKLFDSMQENQKPFAQLSQDGNNIHIQRKQKKNSDSLFKNRNIANIPHLKKYRAGFPYFGKGNIGKKLTSRQAHPVLSPELDEDNDVVIKDVSLIDASEGTLTPIKSRTPVAGRSPAHSGGNVLETENKEYLEHKLKEFEGDLELSSQGNDPEIFENESNLFEHEKQVDDYEGSTDNEETQIEGLNEDSKQESFNKQGILLENSSDSANYEVTSDTETLAMQQKAASVVEGESNKNPAEFARIDKITEKENVTGEIDGAVRLNENTNIDKRKERINKIKQEISMKEELLEKVKERLIETLPEKNSDLEVVHKSRSRSNSIETLCSNKSTSSRDSLSDSLDRGRAKRLSSVESYITDKFWKGKRKRSSSSNSSRNANSCKSSFDSQENKHKRKRMHSKKKKKKYRSNSDSDSDGIPGVDYIVVGRFKGHKEMRVVLRKLFVNEFESVNAEEMIMTLSDKEKLRSRKHKTDSSEENEIHCIPKNDSSEENEIPCIPVVSDNKPKSPVSCAVKPGMLSGFSAEFEKFLAQSRNENTKSNTRKIGNPCSVTSLPPLKDLSKQGNETGSEDSSSKGIIGSQRSSSVENSNGSGNEHGESSSSDMCLSTNHTISHANISNFNSTGDINIFSGILGNKNETIDHIAKQQKFHISFVSEHSKKRKKGNTIHDRMSRAFVGKRRKKHSRKSAKLMKSLSVLHDATMEKLTEDLQQSPIRENRAGPIKLKINLKCLRRSHDFELYSDDVDSDYDAPYCDTMYKLAWFSPPESETGDISPPQPLSPEQMSDIESVDQNVKKMPYSHPLIHSARSPAKADKPVLKEDRLIDVDRSYNANTSLMVENLELKEDRLTLTDIQRTMNSANLLEMESGKNLKEERLTLKDIQKSVNSVNSFEMEGEKCLKEEKLTLADIKKTVNTANLSEMEGEKHLKEERLTISHLKKVINEDDHMSDTNTENMNDQLNGNEDRFVRMNFKSVNEKNENDEKLSTNKCKSGQSDMLNNQYIESEENCLRTVDSRTADNDLGDKLSKSHCHSKQASRLPHLPSLTIPDEQTVPLNDDENESDKSNDENISPPDLGPPIIPRFSPRLYQTGISINDPPPLTVSKETFSANKDSESFKMASNPKCFSKHSEINDINSSDFFNTPPNLIPCHSMESNSYTSLSPRQLLSSDKNSENLKRRPGQSPAACDSTGSITVIHSEEFSDISDDDNDNENEIGKKVVSSQNDQLCDQGFSRQASLSKVRNNIVNYLQNAASGLSRGNPEKETKLREIADFEKRNQEKNKLLVVESCEIGQLDKEKLKNSVKEFERKHEAINLNQNFSTRERNIGNELKRQHSAPVTYTNSSACSSIDLNKNIPQSIFHSNMAFSHMPNLESCKFAHMRQEKLTNATNPKYMTVDCTSQNGYRNNSVLSGTNFESYHSFKRTNIIEGADTNEMTFREGSSVQNLYSPGLHRNFTDGCLNDLRSNQLHNQRDSNDRFDRYWQTIMRTDVRKNVALAESQKNAYSICKNRRISDSIIRNVTNHSASDKSQPNSEPCDKVQSNYSSSDVSFTQLGTGGNKNVRRAKFKPSGEGTAGSTSGLNNQQTMSGHSSERGGGDRTGNGDNRDTDKHVSLQTLTGCQVITPLTAPPTRECVYESANQFGLPSVQAKEAFYGNPKDAPERPREGGGQLLKVSTNLVKVLNEFETAGKSVGLLSWRNLFCAKENLFASQKEDNESLCARLEREPALKYALTGDKNIVVTPCLLPPSRSKVKEWCKGRQLYKALKKQTVIPDIKTDLDSEPNKTPQPGRAGQSESDDVCLNLFTGRRKVVPDPEDLTEDDKPPVLVREEPHENDRVPATGDISDFGERRPTRDRQTDEAMEIEMSPLVKQPRLDDSSQLHSTPMTRRLSADLFDTGCTPIVSERVTPTLEPSGTVTPTVEVDGEKEEDESGGGFITPKRIRPPMRRLSTNTESTLRRALISSQMKQQFSTPALQKEVSQIEGPTPKNSFGFKVTQRNFQDAKALHENQYLTVLSVEIHAETRGDLKPDPEFDHIQVIFYSIFNDVPPELGTRHITGAIIVDAESANQIQPSTSAANGKVRQVSHDPVPGTSKSHDPLPSANFSQKETVLQKSGITDLEVTYVKDEADLIKTFIDFVKRWDPDILVGYEIQLLSWGYLIQRASTLNTNLSVAISRVPTAKSSSHMSSEKDEYGADHVSEIHIAGRIVLNLWRLLRHEVSLNVYTYENVAFHVLHRRVPLFSYRSLTSWYKHRTHLHRWKVINHYVTRVKGNLEMMDQLDIIGRTSEFARVFGIEFYHVLSRGSQYRVESMMLRVAKPLNYIPVSPSVHQRARMKAPECIPLTLEPQSRFYTDPVVVLDFQSLYPSIMIAYNYCFSTCMGRVDWLAKAHEGPIDFGCTSLKVPPSVLKKRQDDLTYSPNGVAFVKQTVKRGVLPVMVEEILKTRLMVKKAMKSYKGDKTLSRMLDARQLGLKLIANVTYGYTGANFSGRMPCIEVGDSIVRKARETLERSIKLVEDTPKWGAKVVYGDTDSMFLLMKGKSKDEAFKIGQEIADTVTRMFPKPVKLKFEKVYLPCVLQTKKRYVGFMYETPDQKEPVFDAKGIETVRRDSCQAVSKILERSIKILFQSRDVSQVKSYVQHQCQKLMEGTVSLQDCIFAKEFRGVSGYRPGACVPALEITKKLIRHDRRAEPRVGERVPYVIVYGSPGLPLIQLVKQPIELLQDGSLRLNATYYITKQILPPLSRFLALLGVDVFSWYQEMPHTSARGLGQTDSPKKGTISQYFATSNCPICDSQTKQPICQRCMREPQMVCVTLNDKIARWERLQEHLNKVCGICMGCNDSATVKSCTSIDCPILYRQSRAQRDVSRADSIRETLAKVFK